MSSSYVYRGSMGIRAAFVKLAPGEVFSPSEQNGRAFLRRRKGAAGFFAELGGPDVIHMCSTNTPLALQSNEAPYDVLPFSLEGSAEIFPSAPSFLAGVFVRFQGFVSASYKLCLVFPSPLPNFRRSLEDVGPKRWLVGLSSSSCLAAHSQVLSKQLCSELLVSRQSGGSALFLRMNSPAPSVSSQHFSCLSLLTL